MEVNLDPRYLLEQIERLKERLHKCQRQRDALAEACSSALEAICAGAEGWMLNDVETKCRQALAMLDEE